jgi:membrane protease YdiL (CAAX protease family)
MRLLRDVALIASLAALVSVVVRAREPGTFPLNTLLRQWFSRRPSRALLLVGAVAGVASVVVVPLIGLLGGWAQIAPTGAPSFRWVALACAGVAVKTAFVLFEELIFRGALVSELRRWTHPAVAVGVSAAVFAAAHSGRSFVDMVILFVDGIGFALAFVATGSLWIPGAWHVSKNLSVWLFIGTGTIDLTHGPFEVQYVGAEWLFGSAGGAGLLDLAVTTVIVGVVIRNLLNQRSGDEGCLTRHAADGASRRG